MTERTRAADEEKAKCPDPRCGKELAKSMRENPDADLCWIDFNGRAHDDLPPWEEWAPKALAAAREEERAAAEARGFRAGVEAAGKVAHVYWTTSIWHCQFQHTMEDLEAEIRALVPEQAGNLDSASEGRAE